MKEQIEEMAISIYEHRPYNDLWLEDAQEIAEALYNAGYRKQKKGKWIVSGMFDDFLKCSSCGYQQPWQTAIAYKYCADCGAKMKGGAE